MMRLKLQLLILIISIQVSISNGLTNTRDDFELCVRAENVVLPQSGYFGVSAATGALAGTFRFLCETFPTRYRHHCIVCIILANSAIHPSEVGK